MKDKMNVKPTLNIIVKQDKMLTNYKEPQPSKLKLNQIVKWLSDI